MCVPSNSRHISSSAGKVQSSLLSLPSRCVVRSLGHARHASCPVRFWYVLTSQRLHALLPCRKDEWSPTKFRIKWCETIFCSSSCDENVQKHTQLLMPEQNFTYQSTNTSSSKSKHPCHFDILQVGKECTPLLHHSPAQCRCYKVRTPSSYPRYQSAVWTCVQKDMRDKSMLHSSCGRGHIQRSQRCRDQTWFWFDLKLGIGELGSMIFIVCTSQFFRGKMKTFLWKHLRSWLVHCAGPGKISGNQQKVVEKSFEKSWRT